MQKKINISQRIVKYFKGIFLCCHLNYQFFFYSWVPEKSGDVHIKEFWAPEKGEDVHIKKKKE